jgi:hypothetical protein
LDFLLFRRPFSVIRQRPQIVLPRHEKVSREKTNTIVKDGANKN